MPAPLPLPGADARGETLRTLLDLEGLDGYAGDSPAAAPRAPASDAASGRADTLRMLEAIEGTGGESAAPRPTGRLNAAVRAIPPRPADLAGEAGISAATPRQAQGEGRAATLGKLLQLEGLGGEAGAPAGPATPPVEAPAPQGARPAPLPVPKPAPPSPARAAGQGASTGTGTRTDPFVLPTHRPDAEAEFGTIKPGEFYVDPGDGKLYRKTAPATAEGRPTGQLGPAIRRIEPREAEPGALGRGAYQAQASGAAGLAATGAIDPDTAARVIAEMQKRVLAHPPSENVRRFFQEGTWKSFTRAPLEITANIIGESFGQFAPVLGLSAASAAAGPAGPVATIGAGSFALEAGGKILDSLTEAGVDLTDPKAVAAAFRDERLMADVKRKAVLKGVPIAAFDMLSMGVAGRVFAPVRKVGGRLGGAGAEIGAQAALGAAGETAGEVSAGEKLDRAQIAAEAIGELGTGPAEIGAAVTARRAGAAPQQAPQRVEPTVGQPGPRGEPGVEPTGGPTAPPPPPPPPPRPQPPAGTEAEAPRGSKVVTPRGREIGVGYEVVEADDLTASHTPDLTAIRHRQVMISSTMPSAK